MSYKHNTEKAKNYIKYLESLKTDKKAIAELKRGLSEATAYRSWPYISPFCDLTNESERNVYQTIGAGFAICKGSSSDKHNLGFVMRRIAFGENKQDALNTFETRFRRILAAHSTAEVCKLVSYVFKVAEKQEIHIDFTLLFDDLYYWGEKTKLRWANSYWSSPKVQKHDSKE